MKHNHRLAWALLLGMPMLARGQTAQLVNTFTATASGNYALAAVPPQVDSLNIRINGIATASSWSAQIQTSPDNSTWSNCGTAVTATAAGSASGGACSPSGALYTRVAVTAGTGGGTVVGVLIGNSTLIAFNSGGVTASIDQCRTPGPGQAAWNTQAVAV